MQTDLENAPKFQSYCKALFDALVVAETYTSYGPGLKAMKPDEQQAYVIGYGAVLFEDRGFVVEGDLLPAARRWTANRKEFPKPAELAEVLSVLRQERQAEEIRKAQRLNAESPALPVSGMVSAEERKEIRERLGFGEFEEDEEAKKALLKQQASALRAGSI